MYMSHGQRVVLHATCCHNNCADQQEWSIDRQVTEVQASSRVWGRGWWEPLPSPSVVVWILLLQPLRA